MKCLVFSDSHGTVSLMKRALDIHRDAEVVFFLGDGLEDAEQLAVGDTERMWIAVRGNNDYFSTFCSKETLKVEKISIGGFTIVMTHGDIYNAKYTTGSLRGLARREGADILLFGHTHVPYEEYISDGEKPLYLFNPGSIYIEDGSYGIIDIRDVPFFSHGNFI